MPDPTVALRNLFVQEFDDGAMPFDVPIKKHTGWYDRAGDIPCITFTGLSEGPDRGGQTGYYGTDGDTGLGMQLISGGIDINLVAGAREDLEGTGPSGEDINPKQARHAMKDHARQLLIDNQRSLGFRSLAPGTGQDIEDTDEGPTVFRHVLRAQFLYAFTPSNTA